MEEPYIRYTTEELSPQSQMFARVERLQAEVNKNNPIEQRREGQLALSTVRIIPARVTTRPVVCDGVPCEWVHLRRRVDEQRVIIYIHGGAWAFGSLESARPVSVLLAETTGFKVLMIQYSLSPEHPFPLGLEDCYRAYYWLLAQGYTPENIGLFGDSAGGNLCLALLHQLKKEGRQLPSCFVGASPVTDITLDSEIIKSKDDLIYTIYEEESWDIFSLYLKDWDAGDRKDPLLSPYYGVLAGHPPMLIHAGAAEPMAVDNIAFVKKAVEEGVDARIKLWKDMFHDFTVVGKTLKESRESLTEIGKFFRKHVGKKP